MVDASKNVWPERLKIRDTQLNDDLGGLGQRIYTTAGAGYEKREYVRGDIHDEALTKLDRCQDALQEIINWSQAYPLQTFPEPDFEKAAKVLKDAGMTLDAISASNMRHVVTRASEIAREALNNG